MHVYSGYQNNQEFTSWNGRREEDGLDTRLLQIMIMLDFGLNIVQQAVASMQFIFLCLCPGSDLFNMRGCICIPYMHIKK